MIITYIVLIVILNKNNNNNQQGFSFRIFFDNNEIMYITKSKK